MTFIKLLSNAIKGTNATIDKAFASSKKKGELDRFLIAVPYCGKSFSFYLILDANNVNMPPDVMLPEDEDNLPLFQDLPIDSWNPKDPSVLSEYISTIINNFKAFQKLKISKYPNERIRFNCETALSIEGSEFLVKLKDKPQVSCHFKIPINISKILSNPSEFKLKENNYEINVTVVFSNSSRPSNINLKLPKTLESLMSFTTPTYEKDMCLVDYIPLIEEEFVSSLKSLEYRRDLIMDLQKIYNSLTEYDSQGFTYAYFLFNYSHNVVHVKFIIPLNYPKESISFTFHSISYFQNKLISSAPSKIKIEGEYSREAAIDKVSTIMKEYVPKFFKKVEASQAAKGLK